MAHDYNVRDAKYANASGNAVDVTIDHPEYGAIPYTLIYNKVDDELSQTVLEALNGLTIGAYAPPVLSQEKQDALEIREAMRYLKDTDWVVTKIAEKQILGQDTSTLVTKYQSIIDEREIKRARLNELGR